MEWYVVLISFLYGTVGIVATIGYFPTIIDLFRKKNSANAKSYATWAMTYLFAFLYGLIVINDVLVSIVSGLGLFCCALISIMSFRLNKTNKK